MKDEIITLIRYRLSMARETLKDAEILFEGGLSLL